ncbi:hypothetical protein N8T08_010900 [Aspergillus melleus]|uniref:Uncharacterized protein n=1 Tax=Aspergillus melleus TaxID=138277 RepID=A0ACC3ARF6_9EURO|nr:hypothetical protein N8T08_010900 [Aspergillus melleus]
MDSPVRRQNAVRPSLPLRQRDLSSVAFFLSADVKEPARPEWILATVRLLNTKDFCRTTAPQSLPSGMASSLNQADVPG